MANIEDWSSGVAGDALLYLGPGRLLVSLLSFSKLFGTHFSNYLALITWKGRVRYERWPLKIETGESGNHKTE
jgi:hypothetical protein